jgi:hypothetical protein
MDSVFKLCFIASKEFLENSRLEEFPLDLGLA